MTKILVTGSAGFISSHFVDLFPQEGYEIVIIKDLGLDISIGA